MRPLKRIHPAWLLTVFSLALLVGVVVSRFLPTYQFVSSWWLAGGIGLFVLAFLPASRVAALTIIVTGGIVIGGWRGGLYRRSIVPYERLFGKQVQLRGTVSVDPDRSSQGGVRMRLRDVMVENVQLGGEVWVTSSDQAVAKRSDEIMVQGVLVKGFGTIPAVMYRADIKLVRHSRYEDIGRDIRDRFSSAVRLGVKDPEASLANGFLVGEQASLPEKLDTDLRLLGLSHIVVASGYNLTILVRFARRLFARISRFSSLVAAAFLVLLFTNIAGTSPSMSRASLVVLMSLVAWFYGRKLHPFVLLSLSAALSVLGNPAYAWGDVGWLLSFGSFVGVLILGPLIHSYFWHQKPAGIVRQLLVETCAAYVVTLPLVVFVFGQYSPLSVVANMLVLPLISPVMALTFIGGIVGILVPSIAKVVGFPAQLLLQYVTSIVSWLAATPFASKEWTMGVSALLTSYVLIATIMLFLWRRSGHDFRSYNITE